MPEAPVLGTIQHLHVHRQENERRDSIELGTAKTGLIKVYGNADDPADFERRIRTMLSLRERTLAAAEGKEP